MSYAEIREQILEKYQSLPLPEDNYLIENEFLRYNNQISRFISSKSNDSELTDKEIEDSFEKSN